MIALNPWGTDNVPPAGRGTSHASSGWIDADNASLSTSTEWTTWPTHFVTSTNFIEEKVERHFQNKKDQAHDSEQFRLPPKKSGHGRPPPKKWDSRRR